MSIENDDIDLGKAIFSSVRTKKSPSDTKTSYGIAKSDSSDGTVIVDMLGLTSGESQEVEMPCTCSVEEGQRVIVTIVGTDPIVTGVAGWGDLVREDAKNALSAAEASVKTVDVEYAVGNSQAEAPASGWSTSTPEWQSGKYIWQRTVIYTSDSATYSDPVCIQGAKGEDGSAGRGVSSITPQYYLSESSSSPSGGTWQTSPSDYISGRYYWTRNQIVWQNPTDVAYTDPVYDPSLTEALSSVVQLKTLIREDDTYGVEVGKSADGKTFEGIHTTMGSDKFSVHAADHTELASFGEDTIELGKNSSDAVIDMLSGAIKISATKETFDGQDYTSGVMQTDGADTVALQAFSVSSNQTRKAYVRAAKDPTTQGYPSVNLAAVYNHGTGDTSKINQTSIDLRSVQDTALLSLAAVNVQGSSGSPSISLKSTSSESKMSLKSRTTSLTGESKSVEISTDKIIDCLSNHSGVNIYIGTKVVYAENQDSAILFSSTDFKNNFGVDTSSVEKYFVAVMNGDGGASAAHCQDCTYLNGSLYVTFDRSISGNFRANFIVVTLTE